MNNKINLKFSVILPVYIKDNLEFFKESYYSILRQSLPPNEIIIIVNGPINKSLDNFLKDLNKKNINSLIYLDNNLGPAIARDIGIRKSKFDYIALMDSDDISLKNRFELQIQEFKNNNYDFIGGWISEFENNSKIERVRKVPSESKKIAKISKFKSPMNNVSIMFKKKVYLQVGGYSDLFIFEDYELFLRLIKSGYTLYNIPKVIVKVRGGINMHERRGGLNYAALESKILIEFFYKGYFNIFNLILNLFLRLSVRMLPINLRKHIYNILLRN